jgi:hypothetical protein
MTVLADPVFTPSCRLVKALSILPYKAFRNPTALALRRWTLEAT